MATYRGSANDGAVVQSYFSRPVDVTVHVENRGDCAVIVVLGMANPNAQTAYQPLVGQPPQQVIPALTNANAQADQRTIRAPRGADTVHSADVVGDGIQHIVVSCGGGQGACSFDYTIRVT
jgi:hypothetical protein